MSALCKDVGNTYSVPLGVVTGTGLVKTSTKFSQKAKLIHLTIQLYHSWDTCPGNSPWYYRDDCSPMFNAALYITSWNW